MPRRDKEAEIRALFTTLFRAWGRQHWWPADSLFEVIVGAFLTQNTAWTNVERAMTNLRAADVLSVKGIRSIATGELEQLIRPSGYLSHDTLASIQPAGRDESCKVMRHFAFHVVASR